MPLCPLDGKKTIPRLSDEAGTPRMGARSFIQAVHAAMDDEGEYNIGTGKALPVVARR